MTPSEQRIKAAWKHFQDRLASIKKKAVQEAGQNEQSEASKKLDQLRKKL